MLSIFLFMPPSLFFPTLLWSPMSSEYLTQWLSSVLMSTRPGEGVPLEQDIPDNFRNLQELTLPSNPKALF